MQKHTIALPILIVALSACTSMPKDFREISSNLEDIDCAQLDTHISRLESQLSTPAERQFNNIATILPTSAIISLIIGDYGERRAIANGDHDKNLHSHIMRIQDECSITDALKT